MTFSFNRASLLVGLLAGIASGLLSLSAGAPSSLSIFLFAAAALPVLIASLGWSNAAGVMSVTVASVVIAGVGTPLAALMFLVTTLAPAAWIGHLALLARPASEIGGPDGALAWYPLADILLQICILVSIGLLVLGYAVGYGPALGGQFVDAFVSVMKAQTPEYQPTDAVIAEMKSVFTVAIPIVQGALWVVVLFAAFYIASAIVRVSGRAKRPKDDVPATLRMPRSALFVLAAAIALAFAFAGGPVGLAGAAVAGAYAAGFTLAGFAMLHARLRGQPVRLFALWIAYLSVVMFTLPLVAFFVAGLLSTRRTVAVTRSDPPARS